MKGIPFFLRIQADKSNIKAGGLIEIEGQSHIVKTIKSIKYIGNGMVEVVGLVKTPEHLQQPPENRAEPGELERKIKALRKGIKPHFVRD